MEGKGGSGVQRFSGIRNLPTPVAQGVYEGVQRSFDRGYPTYHTPVLLRGLLSKPFPDGLMWRMKTRNCEVSVKFFMDVVPPDVVEGKRYTLMGDLLTANLGGKMMVEDCVLIEGVEKARAMVAELLRKLSLPVGSYIDRPTEDTFFVKENS